RHDGLDAKRPRKPRARIMVRHYPAPDRCGDGGTVRSDQGTDGGLRDLAGTRRPEGGGAPRPLAGARDDVTVPVPGTRRSRRARDARGVRRPDGRTEPTGTDRI